MFKKSHRTIIRKRTFWSCINCKRLKTSGTVGILAFIRDVHFQITWLWRVTGDFNTQYPFTQLHQCGWAVYIPRGLEESILVTFAYVRVIGALGQSRVEIGGTQQEWRCGTVDSRCRSHPAPGFFFQSFTSLCANGYVLYGVDLGQNEGLKCWLCLRLASVHRSMSSVRLSTDY